VSQGASSADQERTLEQKRAADALACVERVKAEGGRVDLAAYRSYVERLGSAIIMNGLGQALATELAAAGPKDKQKGGDERAHQWLYDNLNGWLCRKDGGVYPGAGNVLEALMQGSQSAYVRAQMEALAWLEWHKKFCQAALPRREEG